MIRARDENFLKAALELVKPEFKAELEKVMKELAAKWDSLSEDQHEDYYWGDGTIGFVFDDNEDSWKALPDVEELAVNADDTEELEDSILEYICPFEGSEDNSEDASDEDAFNQSFETSNYPRLIITVDANEDKINMLIDQIEAGLQLVGIEKYSIEREN